MFTAALFLRAKNCNEPLSMVEGTKPIVLYSYNENQYSNKNEAITVTHNMDGS